MKLDIFNSYWLITISIVFGLTLPILIQDAMFQDAVLYSSVAHNLAIGHGTFWFPQYSTLNLEGIPSFHEQPPLFFGLQAIFFLIFGSSMYVERFYTLLTIILNMWLINSLWKIIFTYKPEWQKYGWLAVIVWITIPVCFWSYRNNMIENTVSVFTLSSIILSYKNIVDNNHRAIRWICSGVFIFLATFSKGVPGLFPITFPFLYWLIYRDISFKQFLKSTLYLILVPLLIYAALLTFPAARESLSIYFYERLVRRVNQMPTADYRLEIMWRLIKELIPAFLLVMTISMFAGWAILKQSFQTNGKAILLLCGIGLSGSAPLTLTMVQKAWYMVPTFPFFGMAIGALIVPYIHSKWDYTMHVAQNNFLKYVSVISILTMFIITIMQYGKTSREENVLSDVYKIGKIVPKFSTITVPTDMYDQYDFILQGFLVRYFNISISPYQQYKYYLQEKEGLTNAPHGYQKVNVDLDKYDLYILHLKQ